MLLVLLLFLWQGQHRSALVALLTVVAALIVIEGVHLLVPRRRPPDAENWLGADAMLGSYPSTGVFLFMLSVILLGFAEWRLFRRPWQRGLFVPFAVLTTVWVCLSQFFLCLHFVTDVIGGIVGAALFGWIAFRCIEQPADKLMPREA